MAYDFPNVSFDWLGRLPAVAEEAQKTQARRQILADLSSATTTSELDKMAGRLAPFDLEGATKLYNIANVRRSTEQRGLQDLMLAKWLQERKGGTPPGAAPEPPVFDPFGGAPAAPAPGPAPSPVSPFNRPAGGVPTGAPPPIPGPQSALPSPSEEILARAQGGISPPAPGPQLAQMGGPPPGLAPPPAAVPDWLAGAAAPAYTGPPPAPPPARAPTVTSEMLPEQQLARREAAAIGSELWGAPQKFMQTAEGMLKKRQFDAAMARTGAKQEDISYMQERLRRSQEGLPDITFQDFKGNPETIKERNSAMIKNYQDYQTKGKSADEYIQKAGYLQQIMDDPNFIAGKKGKIDEAINNIASLVNYAKVYVPGAKDILPSDETIRSYTNPVALRELFDAVHGQLTLAGLGGGLSKSISDADRNFIEKTNAALSQTALGQRLTNQYNTEVAKRTRLEYTAAGEYAREMDRQGRHQGSPWGMNEYVQKKMDDYAENNRILVNKDGSLTALGQKMQAAAAVAAPQVAPAPTPSATPPPPPAPLKPGTYNWGPNGLVPVQ